MRAVGEFAIALIAVVLVLAVLTGVSWGGYLLYLHFVEGNAISTHAQNIRHSLNFVQSANQRAEGSIAEYQADSSSGDIGHANADRLSACGAADTINENEMQPVVLSFYTAHCGVTQ